MKRKTTLVLALSMFLVALASGGNVSQAQLERHELQFEGEVIILGNSGSTEEIYRALQSKIAAQRIHLLESEPQLETFAISVQYERLEAQEAQESEQTTQYMVFIDGKWLAEEYGSDEWKAGQKATVAPIQENARSDAKDRKEIFKSHVREIVSTGVPTIMIGGDTHFLKTLFAGQPYHKIVDRKEIAYGIKMYPHLRTESWPLPLIRGFNTDDADVETATKLAYEWAVDSILQPLQLRCPDSPPWYLTYESDYSTGDFCTEPADRGGQVVGRINDASCWYRLSESDLDYRYVAQRWFQETVPGATGTDPKFDTEYEVEDTWQTTDADALDPNLKLESYAPIEQSITGTTTITVGISIEYKGVQVGLSWPFEIVTEGYFWRGDREQNLAYWWHNVKGCSDTGRSTTVD